MLNRFSRNGHGKVSSRKAGRRSVRPSGSRPVVRRRTASGKKVQLTLTVVRGKATVKFTGSTKAGDDVTAMLAVLLPLVGLGTKPKARAKSVKKPVQSFNDQVSDVAAAAEAGCPVL